MCRVLLTAIAISYVICVLLLSGLQKGDLDANTLEKLQRHNVNIYDMNNESLRQECVLKSFSDTGKDTKAFEITEDLNDTSIREINKEPFTGSNVAEIQKPEIIAPENYFVDKASLREININGIIQEQNRNDNVNGKPGDINVTILEENKDQQIKLTENNPTLESVLNFWVTIKQNANTGTTKETTTAHSSRRNQEEVDTTKLHTTTTDNGDYLRSKKMEYIGRMLAEILESQIVPTTAQAITETSTNMDIVSTKTKEVLTKNDKNMEDIFGKNVRDMSDLAEFINILNKDQNTPEKFLRTSQKEINNDKDEIEKSKVNSLRSVMNFNPATEINKSEKKIHALQLLNDMLKVNNKFKLNEPFNTEISTQASIINNEQEVRENVKHFDIENANNGNKDSAKEKLVKNIKMTNDPVQGRVVSPDVIQEIAEKVKAIVMKDIMKEIPTTECITALPTVNPTTTAKETNESSVVQTLMALIKEFKTIKEATKTTTHQPVKLTLNDDKSKFRNVSFEHMYPSIMDALSAYGVKTPVANVKQMLMNPYNPNFVPIPVGQLLQPILHGSQQNFRENIENRVRPITIQTNSGEIPPLAIEMSKPMTIMNQHIVLTTLNPTEKQRKENHVHHERKQLFNYHDDNPIYSDLTKKLRIAENVKKEYRESYKDTIEKLKERIKYSPEGISDKAHELNSPFSSDNRVSQIVDMNPRSNRHETFNRPEVVNRHDPMDSNRHEILNRSPESSYRDIITREFLSRLVDSNHHDVISQLVESSPHSSRANEQVDLNHRSRSHQSDAYERFEHERTHPRYKAPKFHEKLEGIENRPQHSYESYSKTTKKNCCEAVAAREQVPLSKIKQRPRFDDTHFRNFIKSQQKVTDMLERILAAKTKSRSHSSEAA